MSPRHAALALLALITYIGMLTAETPKKEKDEFKLTKEEQEVVDLTNKVRMQAGLTELKPSEKLFKAARDHAANMASKRRIGHIIDGSGPGERLATVGYVSF